MAIKAKNWLIFVAFPMAATWVPMAMMTVFAPPLAVGISATIIMLVPRHERSVDAAEGRLDLLSGRYADHAADKC